MRPAALHQGALAEHRQRLGDGLAGQAQPLVQMFVEASGEVGLVHRVGGDRTAALHAVLEDHAPAQPRPQDRQRVRDELGLGHLVLRPREAVLGELHDQDRILGAALQARGRGLDVGGLLAGDVLGAQQRLERLRVEQRGRDGRVERRASVLGGRELRVRGRVSQL
ncbi:hypothetical protein [Lentzea pudingi]|uniref:hypothetical protein n=1 Tax=Lentzea pudingi TaxID=1789439 RepID=UPI00166696B2|nr:hypothetical protein [Lentzea pudingi]